MRGEENDNGRKNYFIKKEKQFNSRRTGGQAWCKQAVGFKVGNG